MCNEEECYLMQEAKLLQELENPLVEEGNSQFIFLSK